MARRASTDPPRRVAIASPCTGEAEWQALREPIESGWLTQGPKVAAFQEAFAKRHGVAHAIATTSCTTALHLALVALEIGPGDEVIVPAFSWIASANVILHCGATPVFVDVDRATYNLDPSRVADAITPRTRAIMAVHLFGLCADHDALAQVAGEIPIVEDAACAVGARIGNRHAGTLGRLAAFSFHPRKSITTGEGGMVTTNDAELASRFDILRNHGASVSEEQRHRGNRPYLLPDFNLLGYNYRMTDLQAAVGVVQLAKLDDFLEERRKGAAFYDCELEEVAWLHTPFVPDGHLHGWQAYVCMIDETLAPMPRNDVMDALEKRGVSTRPGTHAIHVQNFYRERFGLAPDDFPVARDCGRSSIAIPLHNKMDDKDYRYVVEAIRALG